MKKRSRMMDDFQNFDRDKGRESERPKYWWIMLAIAVALTIAMLALYLAFG